MAGDGASEREKQFAKLALDSYRYIYIYIYLSSVIHI